MNETTCFESDELSRPHSDSGEEYVPKTSEDCTKDTETNDISESLGPIKSRLRGSKSSLLEGISTTCHRDGCRSPSELRGSSDQSSKCKRGHSPSGNDSSSGVRSKRQCVNVSGAPSPTQSRRGASGATCLEQNLLDSAEVKEASVCVPAVNRKDTGSQRFSKRQYCLFCKKGYVKIARHLEFSHHNKPEVAQALSFPKGSKERRMHLDYLRNHGNFVHNVDVLNSGVGNLVPRRQPRIHSEAHEFLHCVHCHGLFVRKDLWRHVRSCKFKPRGQQKPGRARVQVLCASAVPAPPGIKKEFWKMLNKMPPDEVCSVIKSDVCIRDYGAHLCNRYGNDVGKHVYVRNILRGLARLLICSRKTTPLRSIQEHIKPASFMHVVQVVKHMAGYNSETDTYQWPSLAIKMGRSLAKISLLLESRAKQQHDCDAAKEARSFRRVYEARWNELVAAAAHRTLEESKCRTPQLLPFTEDVQKLHSYLDEQQRCFLLKLTAQSSWLVWAELAKITLTQVILFNQRRAKDMSNEISKMPLSAYTSPQQPNPHKDVNVDLSDLEKKLGEHLKKVEITGKGGSKVSILLTRAMQEALDLLVSKREECAVLQNNVYIFARPCLLSAYSGAVCLRYFARACGATRPDSLTSTKLWRQTRTLSLVLNLSNTELQQLADFIGCDICVRRQFYRLPEGTLQLAKISKILMALEQGCLADFKGKSLDDIDHLGIIIIIIIIITIVIIIGL